MNYLRYALVLPVHKSMQIFAHLRVFITFCHHFFVLCFRSCTKLFSTEQAIKKTKNGKNPCRLWILKGPYSKGLFVSFFHEEMSAPV